MESEKVPEFKVVLLGNSGVGKTSIINRYINNYFNPTYTPSTGISFLRKTITLPKSHKNVKLAIWDTMGQENYHSVAHINYHGASAFVLVYSITSKASFDGLKFWLADVKEKGPEKHLKMIVGNKGDLIEEEEVRLEDLKRLATAEKTLSRVVSAKNDMGVEELFEELAEKLYKIQKPKKEGVNINQRNRTWNCCF